MNCLQQRFAIQWYLARPCIISGQDARTTRNFGIFFKLEVSKQTPLRFGEGLIYTLKTCSFIL